MNVRFYGTNAYAATDAVANELGVEGHLLRDVYTRHYNEQLEGAALEVQSCVLDAQPDRLRIFHQLSRVGEENLAATFVHQLQSTDPNGFSPDVCERAQQLVESLPAHGEPRTIELEQSLTANAPTLEELQSLGLAMRKPRHLPAEECDADGNCLRDLLPALTWGGEPLEGTQTEMLYEGPAGEQMGWAVMETRVAVDRLPVVGTHLQGFSAVVATADKTSYRLQWAFDLDTGELLATFAVVSLAFDIGARRAMSIPDALRRRDEKFTHTRFHPAAHA